MLVAGPVGLLAWPASVAFSVGGHAAGESARGHAMKAIVQHEYGAPQDVLGLADVEMPVVGAEDVLVSMRASSASGGYQRPWQPGARPRRGCAANRRGRRGQRHGHLGAGAARR